MYTSLLAGVAAFASAVSAQAQGFNYGATLTTGAAKQQSDFQDEFSRAQQLAGTNGRFTSARLYTSIQAGTATDPTSAIPAAIASNTRLLLGLWGSGGQVTIDNEIRALELAVQQYGSAFTDLIDGISVGSEDLYRISPTGIINMSGIGAGPDVLAGYIDQVRSALASTALGGKAIGHVDTWTAWVNGSNQAVINAVDWIGTDAYPYFQTTVENRIELGGQVFFEAYDATVAVSGGKPVWITETGWPVSGETLNQAVASRDNAEQYWSMVACRVLGDIPTWWYTFQDALPDTPSPSFGVVGAAGGTTPLYDLSCGNIEPIASSSSIDISRAATATMGGDGRPVQSSPQAAGGVSATETSAAPARSTADNSAPAETSMAADSSAAASAPAAPAPASSMEASAPAPSAPASSMEASVPTLAPVMNTVEETTVVTVTTCPVTFTSSGAVSTGMTTSTVTYTTQAPAGSGPTTEASASTAAPASSADSQPAGSAPAATPSGSSGQCPADLSGNYEYPHLIVPVNSAMPDTAYGTSYNATFSDTISSIFNFDIPPSDAGKTCSLIFLFPEQQDLMTSAYTTSGSGGLDVKGLSSPATEQTTFSSAPAVTENVGHISSVMPGNSYAVASGPCAAGSSIGYEVSSTGDLSLEYFQDYNPSPIGLYISVC